MKASSFVRLRIDRSSNTMKNTRRGKMLYLEKASVASSRRETIDWRARRRNWEYNTQNIPTVLAHYQLETMKDTTTVSIWCTWTSSSETSSSYRLDVRKSIKRERGYYQRRGIILLYKISYIHSYLLSLPRSINHRTIDDQIWIPDQSFQTNKLQTSV